MATAAITAQTERAASPVMTLAEQRNAVVVQQLDALVIAASRARAAAMSGKLFESLAGHSLVHAMPDLTGCDDLYALAADIGAPLGIDADGDPVRYMRGVRS